MFFRLLKDIAAKNLKNELMSIINSKNASVSVNQDKTNLVKFYCLLQQYGKEIFNWEVETFEIVLGNQGISYDNIMNLVGMVYIVNNADYVLSHRAHFENAVQLLNDLTLYTSSTEYQPPHEIIWAIIGLLTLFNLDNIPIIGDAANYIGESFKNFGWTQPPAFLLNTQLRNVFDPIEPEYYNKIKDLSFQEFGNLCLSIKTPTNGFENYLKHHAPIIKYVDNRINLTHTEIQTILKHKG